MSHPFALRASQTLLRVLIALNILMGVAISALLAASFVAGDLLLRALAGSGAEPVLLVGMRVLMVVGIVGVPLTHLILSRLLAIVRTVGGGEPFVAENAARLQTIAWSMLGLQLLHLVAGGVARGASTATVPLDIDWNFSFAGWLAVLLLFVLAKVFERGAAMREDLEGMV